MTQENRIELPYNPNQLMAMLALGCYQLGSWCCHHTNYEVRQRVFQNVINSAPQCLDCGMKAVVYKDRDEVSQNQFDIPQWDWSFQIQQSDQRWKDAVPILGTYVPLEDRLRFVKLMSDLARPNWKTHFIAYLKSPQWISKKEAVLERSNNLCEQCQTGPVVKCKHITWERCFNEMLEDLIGVCETCFPS